MSSAKIKARSASYHQLLLQQNSMTMMSLISMQKMRMMIAAVAKNFLSRSKWQSSFLSLNFSRKSREL
jgi:pyoverdine/dityrosine biosynthesis protein Dit1